MGNTNPVLSFDIDLLSFPTIFSLDATLTVLLELGKIVARISEGFVCLPVIFACLPEELVCLPELFVDTAVFEMFSDFNESTVEVATGFAGFSDNFPAPGLRTGIVSDVAGDLVIAVGAEFCRSGGSLGNEA